MRLKIMKNKDFNAVCVCNVCCDSDPAQLSIKPYFNHLEKLMLLYLCLRRSTGLSQKTTPV